MKLFLDTANLSEIAAALSAGVIAGVTTNPSLLAKEPKANYLAHMREIVCMLGKTSAPMHLSIEVLTNEPEEMIRQAEEFLDTLNYSHLAIKVPISHHGTAYTGVIHALSSRGVAVNCTACITPMQAIMAGVAGARYVSLFYNRIRDGAAERHASVRDTLLSMKTVDQEDFDPNHVVRETAALLACSCPDAEIIVGSIRTVLDVKQAGLAGAHIVTAPAKIFSAMFGHYKTDEAVDAFLEDISVWR